MVGNRLVDEEQLDIVALYRNPHLDPFTQPSLFKFIQAPNVTFSGCKVSGHHYAKLGSFIDMTQSTNVFLKDTDVSGLSAY